MKKLRKFLIASVMTLSVIAMSGLTAAPASAAATAGDLIKMDGLSSVYYLGDDGKRYVFPNESTYFSWYSDFSGVVTIPASELQSYPLGGNVTMRPGTTLVKITTDPSVYAVEPDGVLRKIQNESQAAALYGTNWNKRIVDLADSFFTNYTIGQPLADGEVPVGSLVKNAGNATVYYYDGTNYRAVASEAALNANRLWLKNVLTITNTLTAGGNPLTGMEAGLVDTAQGAQTGSPITGSGLMVSLNANTPAAKTIPQNVAVHFLTLNLTAANDGPVNVSALTLTAYGLSDATQIKNVTIYDNGVKQGSTRSTVNQDRKATFNFATPIYVAAGTTKTLTVRAEVAAATGSYGLGIAKASDIVSSGASVTGSFPVNGNLMSAVANTGFIGTMEITTNSNDQNVSVEFGEDNVLLADFSVSVENENALVESITLYNGGENDNNIVSNLVMFIDGEEVATGSYADRYATFVLNNYEIEKGDNISVEVRGDMGIVNDANAYFNFYLKDSSDIVAVGKTHGFSLTLTMTGYDAGTDGIKVALTAGDFTLDMNKAATPAKDVKPGTNDVVLATIGMTSNGENATLSSIGEDFFITVPGLLAASSTSDYLQNIELKDLSTGGIYDLTATTSDGKIELSLDEEISFTKGVTKSFEVRADIVDSQALVGKTFQVTLTGGTNMVIEGDVSESSITASPTVTGSVITVKDATLDISYTPLVDANVVAGAEDVIVYQARVEAGTADDVKLQSVKFSAATTTAGALTFTDSNITELSLWLNGKLLKAVSNQISEGAALSTITFSSLNTANYTIPAGTTYDLVVKADFASSLDAGNFDVYIAADADVIARAADGNGLVTGSYLTVSDGVSNASRTITVAEEGELAISLLVTDSKANKNTYVLAGSSSEAGNYLGEIKFVTANEDIKVEKLTLDSVGDNADIADIKAVKLVSADGTVVATSQNINSLGDVTFDPFNIVFDADKSTSLFIAIEAKSINAAGDVTATATHGKTIQFAALTVNDVEAVGMSSNADITATLGANNLASKIATIVGVKLNSVVNAMSDSSTFTGGTKDLAKYTLVFDNGNNRDSSNEALKALLTNFAVTFATSSATVTNPYLYVEGYSANKAETETFAGNEVTWSSDLTDLAHSAEFDGTITLVVGGTVTTEGTNYWVETSIADLAGGDITYSVNGTTALTNMLLPVTSVQGANLSN